MPRDTHGKPQRPDGMANMERTKAERKEVAREMKADDGAPEYPYGLRINLDHDSMKKIGMHELPEVGGEIHIRAKAKIVGASSEQREGSEDRRIELQITHLGVNPKAADEREAPAKDRESAPREKPDVTYDRKRH